MSGMVRYLRRGKRLGVHGLLVTPPKSCFRGQRLAALVDKFLPVLLRLPRFTRQKALDRQLPFLLPGRSGRCSLPAIRRTGLFQDLS